MNIDVPKNGYDKIGDIDLMSWADLIEFNKKHLLDLEKSALKLIQEKVKKYTDYIPLIPVSTGKDSQVVSYLVRKLYPDTKMIFNNTSLDCADTYRMAKTFENCEILSPQEGFYQYIKRANVLPTRFSRFCCRIFKTGEMVNRLNHETQYLMFMGMRNNESSTRSGYKDEWVNQTEWGQTKWQGILPIRTWSELDVWLFTLWKDIEINPKYKKGYARCGCHIACPFAGKSTWVLDKYWYPTMRKRWEDILRQDFIVNNKWIAMNCTIDEYITAAWSGGKYRNSPTQEVVDEFVSYNHLEDEDINVIQNYFNLYCANGCTWKIGKLKLIKSKETISMNMKFHGRNTNKFYCKKCLMQMYEMDEEKWNWWIQKFKDSGCNLF